MDDTTRQRLNAINQDFYRTTATDFDRTRGHPWPGWARVWEALCAHVLPGVDGPLRVLDVGCGNGRLGRFLAERLDALPGTPPVLHYHGMDTDPVLLDKAATALKPLSAVTVALDRRDIIIRPPDAGQYDLVALFGVMHHIPGRVQRQAFMRSLAARTAPGGLLAVACWRFWDDERFRQRVVPWPPDLAECVEAGDHLLDWRQGAQALRYCHHVDDAEHAALLEAAALPVHAVYRADGRSGDANLYAILHHKR